MREILFRGKRTDNGEWVEGGFLPAGGDFSAVIYEIGSDGGYEVDPLTVGQYIGLIDRNGKLIYEGDIVDHHVQGDILVNRGTVCWNSKSGKWSHQLKTMNPDFWLYNPKAHEVIGNIYDNPELWEEKGE